MNSRIFLTVYLLLFSAPIIYSQTNKLAFIQNKGQWPAEIKYKTDFPGGQALATTTGMMVGIFDAASVQARVAWGMKIEDREYPQYVIEHPDPPPLKGHGWRFHFLNSSPLYVIENKGQSNDFYNFWVGDPSTHASKVRSFEEITYKNVYNNIDVKYYTSAEGYLENDIILNPSADPSGLAFEIEGIDIMNLNNLGGLVLSTSVGDVTIPAPISYLMDSRGNKTPILVKFIVDNKVIRFSIPNYDHSQTLVIDPVIVRWATWANNTTNTDAHNHGTGLDSLGNIYITGRLFSSGLITVNAFQTTGAGSTDIFIGKYTEPSSPGGSGSRVWQTYLGGTGQDNSIGLQMGADGYIYLAANTTSDIAKTYGTGFTAGAWTQRTGGGTKTQALVVKLDLAGNGAMTRELGSTSATTYNMQAADIRLLKTGTYTYDLVYSGYITQPASAAGSGDFPTPETPGGTTYTQPSTAKLNAIILRITSNFVTLSWIKNLGSDVSTAIDEVVAITTVDASGNIYAAGYTKASANISYSNPSAQTTRTGTQDGWIMKLNSSGVVQWSRYFNSASSSTTSILSMELNQADTNLIIAGTTSGLAAANITSGVVQPTYGGGTTDLFIAKISKTGVCTNWGTYYGGSGTETNMMGLNTDENDEIYFLGYSSSTNYPTSSNPIQNTNFGSNDAVFTKLNSTGTSTSYSTYYGGVNDDNDPIGQRGILFKNCRVYLSITACSKDMPLTDGAVTTSKTSSTAIPEPLIVSMANPPDLNGNHISSFQTIACHSSPITLTAGVATYNIPNIIRNGTVQTFTTSGSYPNGVPSPSGYQWQQSINYSYTWTNISGATSQNYTPGALVQTTLFRRIISGDYCTVPDSVVAIAVSGTPIVSPTATCAGSTLSFFSNTTGGSGSNTFVWSGPLSFSSTLENPEITPATSANNGYYTVTVTDVGGCKNTKVIYIDFTSCTYSVVLSVSLLSFEAVKDGAVSNLSWQTANEHNSDSFDVERSPDGRAWNKIGSLKAAGNSLKITSYNFTDANPVLGLNYYRLKILDIDGKYKYSAIKRVSFDNLRAVTIEKITPNPFANDITVSYHIPNNGNIIISIIDARGRMLDNRETNATKGLNTIKFNTEQYAAGLYFLKLNYNDISTSSKMLVKE